MYLGWEHQGASGSLAHRISFPETERQAEHAEAFRLRILCHVLIDLIPDEGLKEACNSMKEFVEFYRQPESPHFPFSNNRKVEAEFGKKYTRPPFQLTTE